MSERPLIEDPRRQQVLSLKDETRFVPKGIVSRTVFGSPNARMVLFGFDAGQELTEHTSSRPAMVQILSGNCEFMLADEWKQLREGDLVYMPPGLRHAVKATSSMSMLLTFFNASEIPASK